MATFINLLCVLIAATSAAALFSTLSSATQLTLIPINSDLSPIKSSSFPSLSFNQITARDNLRLLYLDSLAATKKTIVPISSGRLFQQAGNYIVKVDVGTPSQTMFMVMDTSNDPAWIPCSGCNGCSSPTLFTLESSSTYKNIPCAAAQCRQVPNSFCSSADNIAGTDNNCRFNMTYGDSSFEAQLSVDSLTFSADTISNYAFGCLKTVTGMSIPPQGLLGLGRGPLSLLSQAPPTLYQRTFSYCLPNFRSTNFTGSLRLGTAGQPKHIKSTPLLSNPRRPTLYYVNLIGIRIGNRLVSIPPSALAFNPTTGAGTVFDSGTMVTRLVAPAYQAVRDEFRRRVNFPVSSLGGFDTCYTTPFTPPTVTLQFDGMNMTLPEENVVIHSSFGTTTCLAMASAPDNVNSVVNVIASMQQQNHRILYDVPNSRLGVSRELCT